MPPSHGKYHPNVKAGLLTSLPCQQPSQPVSKRISGKLRLTRFFFPWLEKSGATAAGPSLILTRFPFKKSIHLNAIILSLGQITYVCQVFPTLNDRSDVICGSQVKMPEKKKRQVI
jgi:hypothetical protein